MTDLFQNTNLDIFNQIQENVKLMVNVNVIKAILMIKMTIVARMNQDIYIVIALMEFVEMEFQHQMKSVMMGIIQIEMDAANVKQIRDINVLTNYFNNQYAINAQKIVQITPQKIKSVYVYNIKMDIICNNKNVFIVVIIVQHVDLYFNLLNAQCPKCDYGLILQNGECKSVCGYLMNNAIQVHRMDQEVALYHAINNLDTHVVIIFVGKIQYLQYRLVMLILLLKIKSQFKHNSMYIQIQILYTTQEYCNRIIIKIDDFKLDEFNFTIFIHNYLCQLIFDYNKSISENNLIRIRVPIFQSRLLQDEKIYIILRLNQNKHKMFKMHKNNLGGFKNFMTLLDILSLINNLYYINIEFSLNIQMIFQNKIWKNMLFTITQYFNLPSDPDFKESSPHFMENGTDPCFLSLWNIALVLIVAQIIMVLCGNNPKNPRKVSQTQKNIEIIQQVPEQKLNRNKLIKKLILNCEQIVKIKLSYLIKILNLIYLDLVMINQINDKVVLISHILCYLSILLCASLSYISYFLSQQSLILIQNKIFTQSYGTLYERIKINSQAGMNYSFINLLRKTFYIIALVVLYKYPLFQTATCSFISFINVGLIMYENPFKTKQSLIQIGIPDCCIFFLMIIFTTTAIDDKILYFSDQQRFLVGWVVIGILLISISFQLYFILIQILVDLKQKIIYVYDKIIQLLKN